MKWLHKMTLSTGLFIFPTMLSAHSWESPGEWVNVDREDKGITRPIISPSTFYRTIFSDCRELTKRLDCLLYYRLTKGGDLASTRVAKPEVHAEAQFPS